ncbi:MAG: hypothetical protein RBU25_04755, partial [Lentisphaeria bacterium]|nr:hypothetical protein [Lentisphaeria bacterium]
KGLAQILGVSARSIARWTNGDRKEDAKWPMSFPIQGGLRSAGAGKVWVSRAELDALEKWMDARHERATNALFASYFGNGMASDRGKYGASQVRDYMASLLPVTPTPETLAAIADGFPAWVRQRWRCGYRPSKATLRSFCHCYMRLLLTPSGKRAVSGLE